MYFRKIVGEKCYLSPIDASDAEKYVRWLNDREIAVGLNNYARVVDLGSEKGLLERISKEHNYAIVDIVADELIGNCGFSNLDHLNQTGEAGIFIGDKSYWGKGYGAEALSLLVDYGFKALNLHNIWLRVFAFNGRAIRSYEKIGFKVIGRRREAKLQDGEWHDDVFMDILRADFCGQGEADAHACSQTKAYARRA